MAIESAIVDCFLEIGDLARVKRYAKITSESEKLWMASVTLLLCLYVR